MKPQRLRLESGGWRLIHGPIDLIIGADGERDAVDSAHEHAWQRFATVLAELVAELGELRRPVSGPCTVHGRIARRMRQAVHPYSDVFITPMAAVAGAVAEEIAACYDRPGVTRASVNNGGDIALHLTAGSAFDIGIFSDLAKFMPRGAPETIQCDASFSVSDALPVRGIATSGWRGRSFSLGIADSVTVLARTAAEADAAATIIANNVNVQNDGILRRPACELKDDSDLQDHLVTVHVPPLRGDEIRLALQAGLVSARKIRERGLIWNAVLTCQGWFVDTQSAAPQPLQSASASSPQR